jgi:phage-related protein
MSEDLYYNRDVNLSGITDINISDYAPSYGSSVSFSANNYSYKTNDNYYNLIPLSINSLTAKFNSRYEVNEEDAQKIVNFFESKSGVNDFSYQPDASIYRALSGYCEGYNVDHINNQHYEVTVDIDISEAPNLLNWSGGTYVSGAWSTFALSQNYEKYDVVYTGISSNKLNNFYYCTGDHTSSAENSPTGDNSMWTQEFFFEPDIGINNSVKFDIDSANFSNSFKDRMKNRKNIATMPISYSYKNISTKQLKSMLHFLENKGGYRRFRHQIPSLYNRPKVFYCQEWKHNWVYQDSHNLDVSLIEDPMGVIPTGT